MHSGCRSDKQHTVSHPEEQYTLTHQRRHLHFLERTQTSTVFPGEGRERFTVLNLEDYQFMVCALLSDASTSDKQKRQPPTATKQESN